jgi:anti-anti-sigma factor
MEIRDSKSGDIVVLEPAGRLDTKTSVELEEKLSELLRADERRFVIDLAEIEYISSAGLRVLLMLAKKLSGTEGSVCLCSMADHVREVFDIAGFTGVFTIKASRAAALEAVSSRSRGPSTIARLAARLLGARKTGDAPLSRDTGHGRKKATEISTLAAKLLARGPDARPSSPRAAVPRRGQVGSPHPEQRRAQRARSLWERIADRFSGSRR